MHTITFLNEKGGVGKTTLATTVAAGLAIRGKRVLLIDADPQGHSTVALGVKKSGGLYKLIVHETSWDDLLVPPLNRHWAGEYTEGLGELYLLPGNIETQAIPAVCDPTLTLKERLAELDGWADVVIIDTPPTPSALQAMVYIATTHLIYPSQTQHLALDGLAESVGRIHKLNATRSSFGHAKVQLLGVAPTMYEERTTAHQHGLKLITEHFGKDYVLPVVSKSTIWRDREFSLQSIFAYAPEHNAAYEAWSLIDAITRKMGGLVSTPTTNLADAI